MKTFSFGSFWIQQWKTDSNDGTSVSAATNATLDMAIANFTLSIGYADEGYNAISLVKSLTPSVVLNWKAMLKDTVNSGGPSDVSLTGADLKVTPGIANLQGIIDIVNNLDLGNILGSGS